MSLESARKRLDAATPGPWESRGEQIGNDLHFGPMKTTYVDTAEGNLFAVSGMPVADADLIAHAPTDLAAALKVIEAAKGLMSWTRELGPHGGYSYVPNVVERSLLVALDAFEALP